MASESLDEEFLRLNQTLKLVAPDRIAAARTIQLGEKAAGQPGRPLIDILRTQGVLDAATEARFLQELTGPDARSAKPASGVPADPFVARSVAADRPTEITGSSWVGADQTLLDLSPPTEDPGPRGVGRGIAPVLEHAASEDLQLGRIFLTQGLVTEATIRECLAIQAKSQPKEGGSPPRLGELLVEHGYVTAEQVRSALAAQKRKILYCARCNVQLMVELRPEVLEYRCGTCRSPLVDPPADKGLKVDESSIIYILREALPAEVQAAAADPAARFGKYIIVSEIAHGGIGVVYKAWDTYFGQYVALKRPKLPASASVGQGIPDAFIESLIKEARSLVLLRHPHIVAVRDIGRIEGALYMSMEYIEGKSLAQLISEAASRGQISPYYEDPGRYLRYLRDVARALHYAHTLPTPVIHCDLKPSNVLIDGGDRAIVVDFGVAQKLRAFQSGEAAVISGTPSYMAPEQAAGRSDEIDPRTDVYGLGAILYELLTGRPPFLGSLESVLRKAIGEVPDRPSDVLTPRPGRDATAVRGLPAALEELCLKCLEKERSMRWQTAGDVADALDRLLKEHRVRAAPAVALAPPAGTLTGAPGDRRALACRCAYVYLRREGLEPQPATALACVVFERSAAERPLRDALLNQLAIITPQAAAGPVGIDCSVVEAFLPFLEGEPALAFSWSWAAETVRLALGVFHQECERTGKREVYAELYAHNRWGGPDAPIGRVERRARRRFREILRGVAAETLKGPDETDAELKILADFFPPGSIPCRRCGWSFDPGPIAQLYAGFCPRCLINLALAPAPPLEELGPYEILGRLRTDAYGESYRARRMEEAQEVELRILRNRGAVEPARAAMRVRHRAAVTVLDAGESDGKAYIVSELVEGVTLKEAVPAGGFPRGRAAAIVRAIAEAVERIHEAGVVHGHLDATQVVVDRNGEPHVGGFGLTPATPEARAADVSALGTILATCFADPYAAKKRSCASASEFLSGLEPGAPSPPKTPAMQAAVRPARARQPQGRPILAGAIIGATLLLSVAGALMVVGLLLREKDQQHQQVQTDGADGERRQRAIRALEAVLARVAERKDLPQCSQAIAEHVKSWPDDVHGQWLASYAEFARGDFDAAERDARHALRIDQATTPAWRIVGLVAMERLDFAAARDALGRSLERYERWGLARPAWDDADNLLAQGLLAYAKGEMDNAAALIEKSNLKRNSAEASRWLGFVSGDPKSNVFFQTAALRLRPDYAPAFVERGVARVVAGEWDAAIADLDRALQLAPNNGRALLHRGVAHAARGRLDAAEADLSGAVELVPGELRGWLERAKVRSRRGNHRGAFDDASQAVKLGGMLAECHLERGRAQWKLGRHDEAELDFVEALQLDQRLKVEIERIRREKE